MDGYDSFIDSFLLLYAEFLEVKWGMVESGPDTGHCSFTTSNNVTEPPEDILYN